MNGLNTAYLEELVSAHRKATVRNRVLMAVAVLIVFVTTYVLILPAITMSHETFCGQEHEHEQMCYSNPAADVESVDIWESTIPADLTGSTAEKLQLVAESQLGYTESEKNYQITDGIQKGYTRYGEWGGTPYADWNQLFVMFCMEYAGAADDYVTTDAEEPLPGDLLLMEGSTAGIITEVDEENSSVTVIEGDSMDQVRYVTYEMEDSRITGLGLIAERSGTLADVAEDTTDETDSADATGETADNENMDDKESDSVAENENESPDTEGLTYKDENIAIQVKVPAGAELSPNAELQVVPVNSSDKAYVEDASIASLTADRILMEQQQYSMMLVDDGKPVKLEEPVQVSMTYSPNETEDNLQTQAMITQVNEDETSVVHSADVEAGGAVAANFSTKSMGTYNVMLLANTAGMPAGQYGRYNLSYNEVKDSFTNDAAYDIYYNENSPLGTAGSFHLVGFDTVTLGTHTNGNVLAKNLIAHSNYGTNNYLQELSYVQNYQRVNGGSASMTTDHILVIGSDNTVTLGPNRDEFYINGTKLDRPYELVQDVDTASNPFIDLERVKTEIQGIAADLAEVQTTGVTVNFGDENNRSITLNDPSGSGFYTVTAKELQQIPNFSDRKIKMQGFQPDKAGSIIINIDCTGITKFVMPDATIYIGGVEQSTNETTNFSNGKVIWNFINAEGVTIETKRMTGMVIAPGANVEIMQNLNGTVVAENIHVKAESHRTDFTGDIEKPGGEKPSGLYLKVKKVDADNISIHLDKAKFDLYHWDSNEGKYIRIREGLTYEDGKALALNDLEYNRAYRLVEVTAPVEYKLSEVPYEFIIPHENTQKYPVNKPRDFGNNEIEEEHTIFFKNERMKELIIKKVWADSSGNPKETVEKEIVVDVWRNTYSDEKHTQLISSEVYKTNLAITAEGGWTVSLPELPGIGTKYINGVKTKVHYTYFVKEHEREGYHVMYDGNGGMVGGVITITNMEKTEYLIPETGGPGTYLCAMAGMLFVTVGALLLVIYRLRRREVSD